MPPSVRCPKTRHRPARREERARAYKISEGSLEEHYRERSLLKQNVLPEDIAEVLAMPLATVKSHLQRSLAMLREKVTRTIGEVTI